MVLGQNIAITASLRWNACTLQELILGVLGNGGGTLSPYYILNNGFNRNGFTEKHIFNKTVRMINSLYAPGIYLMPSGDSTEDDYFARIYWSQYDGQPQKR